MQISHVAPALAVLPRLTPGSVVGHAERVYWVHPIEVGARQLGDPFGWTSLPAAIAATALLTAGPDVPAAGIFRRGDLFFAQQLQVRGETGAHGFDLERANDLRFVRGVDPRLVAVVDGPIARGAVRSGS